MSIRQAWFVLSMGLLLLPLGADWATGRDPRVITLNINFVDYCDGLDLQFRDRLGVIGRHTGCGFNEVVRGNEFTTADNEQGVTVQYFDRTLNRRVQVDVFQTGFRAGHFYVYDLFNGEILRYGDWEEVP